MDIKGKRVLVTGGAVRIGRAVCLAFAEAGAEVVIHCNKSFRQAQELLAVLPGSGHRVIQGDLNFPEGLLERCGEITVLINNASVYRLPQDAEEQYMKINYSAPMSLMKQFFRKNPDEGCIINFLDAGEDYSSDPYAVSKQALHDATLEAALKFAPRIRVNAVAPGPVLPPAGLKGPGMRKILEQVPMGRQIPLKDVTDACLFLARNESLTGQVIYVDGGRHLV
ncbi:MAG: SDR family oxidoreductase [Victivallaceae bacterium]|nr:SDR family oxidoreductase [Victivallaceae bacterium]